MAEQDTSALFGEFPGAEKAYKARYGLEQRAQDSAQDDSQTQKTTHIGYFPMTKGDKPSDSVYVPRNKGELRQKIRDICKTGDKPLPKNFSEMKTKQLYAIYFNMTGINKKTK